MSESRTTWQNIAVGVVALVVITGLGIGALVLITKLLAPLLGDVVSAAIIAAAAPIVASFSLGIWTNYRDSIRSSELTEREQRREAYGSFLAFLYDSIQRLEDDDQPDDFALESDRYASFVPDILTLGSDELIEAWNEFRAADFESLDSDAKQAWYARLLERVRSEMQGEPSDLSHEDLYDLYTVDTPVTGDEGSPDGTSS